MSVHYFDSLAGSRHLSAAPGMMKRYMEEQHRKIGEETEYTISVREDAPLQYNGVDCGVFVCQYAERMARGSRMDFSQKDMGETRERMIEELMRGEISSDWGSFKRWRKADKEEQLEGRKPRERKARKGKETGRKPEKAKDTPKGEAKEEAKAGTEKGKTKTEGNQKERINWPKANSPEWERLDENLTEILKLQCISPENSSVVHPALIYTLSLERFGKKGAKTEKPQTRGPSKRQVKCKRLREEIKVLKETYYQAEECEKEAVKQLQEWTRS